MSTNSRTDGACFALFGLTLLLGLEVAGRAADFPVPVVTLVPISQVAAEAGDFKTRTALLEIRREGGDLAQALPVFFELSGTATAGKDYAELASPILIEPGQSRVFLAITAFPDNEREGDEAVVAALVPAPFLGPIDLYKIGKPSEAKVVIRDAPPTAETVLIAKGSDWRYLDDGSDAGKAWRAPDFPDAAWLHGRAQLGYGDGDETTVVSYGKDPMQRHITTYFRRTLQVQGAANATALTLGLLRDDGAVVYLNGTEVFRSNLPAGPITFTTLATANVGGEDETTHFYPASIPTGLLREGRNVVAVEVHQVRPASTDLSFDLELKAEGDVSVLPDLELPTVTIVTLDGEAVESQGDDALVFKVARTGGTSELLNVYFELAGTATLDVDYQLKGAYSAPVEPWFGPSEPPPPTNHWAIIPAGASEALITAYPVPDKALEGNETVVIGLSHPIPSPLARMIPTYEIGRPNEARGVIVESPPAKEATLVITAPKDGAQFAAPATIAIEAVATDPNGSIRHVEFLANEKPIGTSDILTKDPDIPGKPRVHYFTWKDVTAGDYALTARAQDAAGNHVLAPPVRIVVKPGEPQAFVSRVLPPAYQPGVEFTVTLLAQPGAGVKAYAVEDQPPRGWKVSRISHEGIWDVATGKVKFGPFFDAEARTLIYLVTPLADRFGPAEFAGTGSADGQSMPIGGDRLIQANLLHPADRAPADNAIDLNELTAYGAAWKSGEVWPNDPNPIPLSYVTRAGALWRGGERYRFDPQAGPLPLAWVNVTTRTVGLDGRNPGAANVALREVPPVLTVGQPFDVTLHIRPARGVAAFAVEEWLPSGSQVTGISDNGRYDERTGALRWGPFLDGEARALRYRVERLAAEMPIAFRGMASFDGADIRIVPADGRGGPRWRPHITGVVRRPDRSVQLTLIGDLAAPGYDIEVSNDLKTWTRAGECAPGNVAVFFTDPAAPNDGPRFYRAVLRSP